LVPVQLSRTSVWAVPAVIQTAQNGGSMDGAASDAQIGATDGHTADVAGSDAKADKSPLFQMLLAFLTLVLGLGARSRSTTRHR
jgi:hypothetical protein